MCHRSFPLSEAFPSLSDYGKGTLAKLEYLELQMPNSWECYKTCRALQLLPTLSKSVCACAHVSVSTCVSVHAHVCVRTQVCVRV